jgi:hypothetical protein
MVTRQFDAHDPVVVTIAKITAGSAHNVIPDSAHMKGTMRSLSPPAARLCVKSCPSGRGIAAAHGLSAKVTIHPGFPVTLCDPRAVDLAQDVAGDLFERACSIACPRRSWGRKTSPMSSNARRARCCFWAPRMGVDAAHACGIHSPRMVLDEAVLPRGSACWRGRPALSGTGFRPMMAPRGFPEAAPASFLRPVEVGGRHVTQSPGPCFPGREPPMRPDSAGRIPRPMILPPTQSFDKRRSRIVRVVVAVSIITLLLISIVGMRLVAESTARRATMRRRWSCAGWTCA